LPYLSGTFSNTEVAVPVESLDVASSKERVTFRISPIKDISSVQTMSLWSKLFRLEILPITLVPPLSVLFLLHFEGLVVWQVLLALLSVTALHAGIFSLNDYVDHMTGVDRLGEKTGSRVIQTGQVKAFHALRLSLGALFLSICLSVPLILINPILLVFGLMAAIFGAFGYIYARSGYRRLILGGLSVFTVFGPLLVFGMATLIKPDFSWKAQWVDIFWLSMIFGFCATMYSQSRQLASQLVDHQVGIRTLAVRLGFDGAKYWLLFLCHVTMAMALYFWSRQGLESVQWLLPAYATFVGVRFAKFIWGIRSPLGSKTEKLANEAIYYEMMLGLIIILSFWLKG
jgi:1,4-dihydroxy-2-naphthoate octaprenyltransferase